MKLTNKNILTLIAAGFLFIALFDGLPYGYFTFLRFVVCAIGFYLTFNIYEENKESLLVWIYGGIAVLFNPIIPIHLERETWWIIDLIVGVIFLFNNKENIDIMIDKFVKWKNEASVFTGVLYLYLFLGVLTLILISFVK